MGWNRSEYLFSVLKSFQCRCSYQAIQRTHGCWRKCSSTMLNVVYIKLAHISVSEKYSHYYICFIGKKKSTNSDSILPLLVRIFTNFSNLQMFHDMKMKTIIFWIWAQTYVCGFVERIWIIFF